MASGYYNKKHYYKNRKYLQPTNHTAQPERQARAYQTELLESALKGNRIIALGVFVYCNELLMVLVICYHGNIPKFACPTIS